MKEVIDTLQFVVTVIGVYVGWFIGGFDELLYALVAFAVIDYVSGVMVGVIEKKLSSGIGFRGIFKKMLIFIFVGVGHTIDFYILKNGSAVRTAVIFFYLSNEGLSILENSSKIGLPIPNSLRNIFKDLNKEDDAND
ncbi:phage holin family protein [Tissierella creatinophila]|uniref:Holin family protein n=1 Tax=Tissierella creatinophila DSM 6911 TaxID=1123403 RepID=A0A1U7M4K9_TISCR|nr:phage holin family protein [Tissierella creatinophila]OLS02254.1 holin family protein [Tissierella creatinophila DSM 6911]